MKQSYQYRRVNTMLLQRTVTNKRETEEGYKDYSDNILHVNVLMALNDCRLMSLVIIPSDTNSFIPYQIKSALIKVFFSFSLSSDGKPFFQPEQVRRGRMPFPPPPSSGSNPKSNTSSNFQAQKTNWKWLRPDAVLAIAVVIFLSFNFVSFSNLGWNEFRFLGTSSIKST